VRYEPEKKTPGKIVEFFFEAERLHITSATAAQIAVTLVAA
jgi:hypothetical protein